MPVRLLGSGMVVGLKSSKGFTVGSRRGSDCGCLYRGTAMRARRAPGRATRRMRMDAMWSHMFSLSLPVAEKMLRPVLVYAFLIVGLRLAGKRELAQLNPFDLVVLLTLSNTVQNAIIGEDNSITGGLIGATTLLVVNYVLVRFVSRHAALERFVEGH